MNIKQEKEKEYLALRKAIRELRMIRYNHLGSKKALEIEKVLDY